MDWQRIKTEYITTDTSYRKLAKKYGVSYTSIGDKSRKEGWQEEREQFRSKSLSKTLSKIAEGQAKRAVRLQDVTDKLLSKIEKAVDLIDMDVFDTQAIRQITASLKDIKDIQMIRSDADMREQEARIANLRRQAERDEGAGNQAVTVLMGDNAEEYAD